MKLLKNIILPFFARTCMTCVAVTYIFFFFVQLISKDMRGISFLQYLWLFVFSLALAASFYLFRIPLAKPLLVLMHYGASALAFFVIFSLTGNLSFKTTAQIFVAIALYTILYALVGGIYLLVRTLIRRFEKAPSDTEKKDTEKKKEKPTYEKRF